MSHPDSVGGKILRFLLAGCPSHYISGCAHRISIKIAGAAWSGGLVAWWWSIEWLVASHLILLSAFPHFELQVFSLSPLSCRSLHLVLLPSLRSSPLLSAPLRSAALLSSPLLLVLPRLAYPLQTKQRLWLCWATSFAPTTNQQQQPISPRPIQPTLFNPTHRHLRSALE